MSLFQPFDPDEFPGRKRIRLQQVPIRAVLPNLVTLFALCAGLTAIRMAIEHRFELAIAFIAIAAALDGIDGRMARFLKSTSRFGAELDSITDFLNFGVAPVILVHVWSLADLNPLGWMAALIYAICAALRLARFNAGLDAPHSPDWMAGYFIGVPAPAGALLVMLPLYIELIGVAHGPLTGPVVFVYTIAIGLLMVSKVPTWSGKLVGRRMRRDLVAPLFVSGVAIVVLLLSFPFQTMTALSIFYLCLLPFSWRAFQIHQNGQANDGAKPEGA